MTVKDAIASCLMQYASCEGRASRGEFWCFAGFIAVMSVILYVLSFILPDRVAPILQALVFLALAIPLFMALVRRLHDTGASGWRAVILLVPVAQLLGIWWLARPGQPGDNAYGPAPTAGVSRGR